MSSSFRYGFLIAIFAAFAARSVSFNRRGWQPLSAVNWMGRLGCPGAAVLDRHVADEHICSPILQHVHANSQSLTVDSGAVGYHSTPSPAKP